MERSGYTRGDNKNCKQTPWVSPRLTPLTHAYTPHTQTHTHATRRASHARLRVTCEVLWTWYGVGAAEGSAQEPTTGGAISAAAAQLRSRGWGSLEARAGGWALAGPVRLGAEQKSPPGTGRLGRDEPARSGVDAGSSRGRREGGREHSLAGASRARVMVFSVCVLDLWGAPSVWRRVCVLGSASPTTPNGHRCLAGVVDSRDGTRYSYRYSYRVRGSSSSTYAVSLAVASLEPQSLCCARFQREFRRAHTHDNVGSAGRLQLLAETPNPR